MGVAVQGGLISFEDLDEARSPQYQFTRDGMSATRVGKVAGSDLAALYLELYPSPPAPPGAFPGISFLYVDTVSIVPQPEPVPAGSPPVFNYYEATIHYSPIPYETGIPGEPLITRRYGVSGEFITVPETGMLWASDGRDVKADEQESAKRVTFTDHFITWHRAISIPAAAIRANAGKINLNALNNRYFNNVAANALLYLGAEIGYSVTTDGTPVFTIEHKFQEKIIKADGNTYYWNHQYDPLTQSWDKMITATGSYVYDESADFNDLFL